jgi:hypothetical protein
MTCKYNYKSISLRNQTMDKVKHLSETLEQGHILSNAKTVEKLIDDSFERQNKKETINVTNGFCKA